MPQCATIKKKDAVSPIVPLDSVFIKSTIDAKEGWCLVTMDLPGEFHNSHQDPKDPKFIRVLRA